MRRMVVGGLAGIALIFGGSVYLLLDLTSPDTTERLLRVAPDAEPPRSSELVEPASARPAPEPLSPPAEDPATPPPEVGPVEVAPDVVDSLAASASQVRVVGQLEALQARITSRCGSMELRSPVNPADPAAGLSGQAVILLDLQSSDGEARVTGSRILSQGAMRPALTACAQYALRNQVFPAAEGATRALTVPVILSMVGGSP